MKASTSGLSIMDPNQDTRGSCQNHAGMVLCAEPKPSDSTVMAAPITKPALPQTSTIVQNISNKETAVSKYAQLLNVVEEMGRDVRPTYAGNKSSAERLKRSIVHARILVKECLMETERCAKQ